MLSTISASSARFTDICTATRRIWAKRMSLLGTIKAVPSYAKQAERREAEVQLYPYSTLALEGGGGQRHAPAALSIGRDPVVIIYCINQR
jgi:hypothetical protein